MNKWLLTCLTAGVAASSASAQSMNIDFGTGNAAPASTYGAAASVGFWNNFGMNAIGLQDLSGGFTGASLAGTPGGLLLNNNDPGTFNDDELLMDDVIAAPVLETYIISGLAAGSYDVYLYGWSFAALPTQFDVNSIGAQQCGGNWPGGFAVGVTHVVFASVSIGQNQNMTIEVASINGALGAITGMQLVQVPAPGVGAFAFALLLPGRRRRA
jgi:hypothetical protein